MVPYDSLNDLKQFMLMEVYIGCNFCTPPPLDQVVLIQQEEPNPPLTAQPYVDGPIEVTGDLKLWEKNSSIKVFAERSFLFILENATVKSLPPGSFRAKPSPHAKGRHPGIQNKQDPALPPGR